MVSVIVPVFNHAEYLRQRLDSILNQTYKDYELIVLDDGSSDNSREVIREYAENNPWIITCFNESNNGSPFKQWNKGVRLSKGDYVWIAESDDYADRYFLEKTLREITKSENIGLVYTDTLVVDEEKRIKYYFSDRKRKNQNYSFIEKKVTMKYLVANPIPNASSILFRKKSYVDAGLADDSMKFCADWLLTIKIAMGKQIIYLPEVLSTYRLHKSSSYHKHYTSNRLISEKWKICLYLIHNSKYSFYMYFLTSRFMIKSILLRLMNKIGLPSYFMPEIPHRPKKYLDMHNSYSE